MEHCCRVYWGSHGCHLERGHDGPHLCDEDCSVGAPPYYGPDVVTRFYGEDAAPATVGRWGVVIGSDEDEALLAAGQ